MNLYGKTYISIGGYKCRMWYHLGITITFKRQCKLIGYYDNYYDGSFHNFYIYPIWIHWHKRPEIIKT